MKCLHTWLLCDSAQEHYNPHTSLALAGPPAPTTPFQLTWVCSCRFAEVEINEKWVLVPVSVLCDVSLVLSLCWSEGQIGDWTVGKKQAWFKRVSRLNRRVAVLRSTQFSWEHIVTGSWGECREQCLSQRWSECFCSLTHTTETALMMNLYPICNVFAKFCFTELHRIL